MNPALLKSIIEYAVLFPDAVNVVQGIFATVKAWKTEGREITEAMMDELLAEGLANHAALSVPKD